MPPSLAVTTGAAAAVGQMRHTSTPSHVMRPDSHGSHCSRATTPNVPATCIRSSHRCQRRGRSSRGLTLQKVKNSIRNMNDGMTSAATLSAAGFRGDSTGKQWNNT